MNHNSILRVAAACGMSAWLLMMIVGCNPKGPSSESSQSAETQPAQEGHGHAHDQGHDHGHGHEDTGPHGGHIVEIGDEQLHAEWTHDAEEVVVYLLDSSAKADAAISAATISITTKIGETETTYELPAVSQEDGQSSRFALSDPSMVEALKAVGPGVEATIVVNVNGEALVGKFEKHEHDDHKH